MSNSLNQIKDRTLWSWEKKTVSIRCKISREAGSDISLILLQIKNLLVEKQILRQLQILLMHGFMSEDLNENVRSVGTKTSWLKDSKNLQSRSFIKTNLMHAKLRQSQVSTYSHFRQKTHVTALCKSFIHLSNTLDQLTVSPQEILSVDVDSLFTNVLLRETLDNL